MINKCSDRHHMTVCRHSQAALETCASVSLKGLISRSIDLCMYIHSSTCMQKDQRITCRDSVWLLCHLACIKKIRAKLRNLENLERSSRPVRGSAVCRAGTAILAPACWVTEQTGQRGAEDMSTSHHLWSLHYYIKQRITVCSNGNN
jgi:hypothetical protein